MFVGKRLMPISTNHKICKGGKESSGQLVQPLVFKKGLLDLADQDHVQVEFQCLQGESLLPLWVTCAVLTDHRYKSVSWHTEETSSVSVCAPSSASATGHLQKETCSVFFVPSLQVFVYINKIPLSLLLFRQCSPSSESLLMGEKLQSFHHLCSLLLDFFQLCPCSSCSEEPRTGHSPLDEVFPVLSRREGSPPSECWQHFVI